MEQRSERLNPDELSFEDIRCKYHVGRTWSKGAGRNKVHGYNSYIFTNKGEIEVSEWKKLARALIIRHNEKELFRNLKEYYSEPKGLFDEEYALDSHVRRIFNNEQWVGFLPFNQKYRPSALKGVNLVLVKCKCCNQPGWITKAQYEMRLSENKCVCPICGRHSEMEVEKMRKIDSLKILTVTMEGFKCFREKTEFEFGDMTLVKGANGLGKSSIADAISFAFVGTSFFGEQKGLDKLHNPESPEMEVSINLLDGSGAAHTLTRTHKSDATTITFDGYNIRQVNMNEVIGERDLFLSMFNPLYVIDTLGSDGKEFFERLLPYVKHEAVLDTLPDSVKNVMKDEKILSPETYIKNRRKDIRDMEENLIYLQGQEDLLDSEIKNAINLVEQITGEIEELDRQIDALEQERDNNRLSGEEEEQLVELYRRLDEVKADKQHNQEINRLVMETHALELKLEKLKASVYQPDSSEYIIMKEAELRELHKEYDKIRTLFKLLQPGYKCPTCLNEITEHNLPAVKSGLHEKFLLCVNGGTKVKTELAAAKQQEEKKRLAFEKKISGDIALLEEQIAGLKAKCETADADRIISENEQDETINKINCMIQILEYRKENGSLTLEEVQTLNALRQKKHDLGIQLEAHQYVKDKPRFTDQINETEKEISRLKVLVNDAAFYIGRKNELVFKNLNMNRVKILLYEVIKSTGEIKDTFKFTYDGKEYKRLSLSEKIRAGLEVAELIKKLSGKDFPTFIDNIESVNPIDNVRPTGQLIFSFFEKGQPLTVIKRDTALRKVG